MRRIAHVALGLLVALAGASAHADVLVPGGLEATEGVSNTNVPFLRGNATVRTQVVYRSTEFPTEPIRINRIAFRPDLSSSAWSTTIPDLQVSFSTTAAPHNSLSLTFADNVGPDETLVFSGPLASTTTASGPPGGPNPFDLVIELDTPFIYDPSQGNLLVDLRQVAGPPLSDRQSDSHTSLSFSSQIFSLSDVSSGSCAGGGVDAPVACVSTANAIVTQFDFDLVSQIPAAGPRAIFVLALALLGAVALAVMARARTRVA